MEGVRETLSESGKRQSAGRVQRDRPGRSPAEGRRKDTTAYSRACCGSQASPGDRLTLTDLAPAARLPPVATHLPGLALGVLTPPSSPGSARPRAAEFFSVPEEYAQRGGESRRSRGCQLTSAFRSMGVSSSYNHDNRCWSHCLCGSHSRGDGRGRSPLLDWLKGAECLHCYPQPRVRVPNL